MTGRPRAGTCAAGCCIEAAFGSAGARPVPQHCELMTSTKPLFFDGGWRVRVMREGSFSVVGAAWTGHALPRVLIVYKTRAVREKEAAEEWLASG